MILWKVACLTCEREREVTVPVPNYIRDGDLGELLATPGSIQGAFHACMVEGHTVRASCTVTLQAHEKADRW